MRTLIVVVLVMAAILAIGLLLVVVGRRRRRRQDETAQRLFEDRSIFDWNSTDTDQWTPSQHEAALKFYNAAGRQARVGVIRPSLVPEGHRTKAKNLVAAFGDDEEARSKWSDLVWLTESLDREPGPALSPSAGPNTFAGAPNKDEADVHDLAGALGLSGPSEAKSGSVPSRAESESDEEKTGSGPLAGVLAEAAGPDSPTDVPDDRGSPSPGAKLSGDRPKPSRETETKPARQLPNVPAWILEARAAVPVTEPEATDNTEPEATDNPEPEATDNPEPEATKSPTPATKPVLAGTDFPWPDSDEDEPQPSTPNLPEPVDFIPNIDPEELLDGNTDGDVVDESRAASPTEDSAPTIESDTTKISQAKAEEIRRLRRKASKARKRSKRASRLAVTYAREGRRKKARAAANDAFDQADRAKRLKRRARRIERSLDE